MKILYFVIYVVLYVASLAILQQISSKQQKKYSRIVAQANGFISTIFLFIFIWLLTGYTNFILVGAFLVVQILGFFLTKLLITFLASDDEETPTAQILAVGAEWGARHPYVFLFFGVLSILILIVYPIIIGIVYFSHEIPSTEGTQSVIKYFLFLNFAISSILAVPSVVGLLVSKNIQDDTRTLVMVQQIAGLFTLSMWLALALWASGLAETNWFSLPVGESNLAVSPILLIIIFSFFGFVVLFPYLIGSKRAKTWRQKLLKRERNWLEKLIEILEFPKLQMNDVESLRQEVGGEITQLRERKEIIEFEKQFGNLDVDDIEGLQQVFDVDKKTRNLDPRFNHFAFLNRFQSELDILVSELPAVKRRPKILEYAEIYRDKKDEITKKIEAEESKNPQIYAIVILVLTAVASALFSAFGKWAWERFTSG